MVDDLSPAQTAIDQQSQPQDASAITDHHDKDPMTTDTKTSEEVEKEQEKGNVDQVENVKQPIASQDDPSAAAAAARASSEQPKESDESVSGSSSADAANQNQNQVDIVKEEASSNQSALAATSSSSSTTPNPNVNLVAEDSQSRDTAYHSRRQASNSIQETYQPSSSTGQTDPSQPQPQPQPQPHRNGIGRPQGSSATQNQNVRPQQQQQQQQRPQPTIRLRVLSIEKAGRDLVVRMDSMVNHPAYRLSSYSFSRSYRELSLFTLALSLSLPSIIIPFLPFLPPPLSSPRNPNSDLDSDLKSLRVQLSTWFNRLLTNPSILNHPELRSLIETEFSYLPSLNPTTLNLPSPISRKKLQNAIDLHQHGGSVNPLAIADLGYGYETINSSSLPGIGIGSSVMNQLFSSSNTVSYGGRMGTNVFDDDELLVAARAEVTRLELQFKDAGQAVGKRSGEIMNLNHNLQLLSNRFLGLAQVEDLRISSAKVGFPKGLEAVGRGLAIDGVGDERESSLDLHHLSHALLYQSLNARSAKEALLTRNALVEEHHNASKAVIARRREIDVLRSSRSIRRDRVDEKVEELEEALRLEKILDEQLKFLSKSLGSSLQNHSRETHRDLMESLKRHSVDRLKTNREILTNLKVMKEGLGRIGKDWNNAKPPLSGGMIRKVSSTNSSNGYGYQQQPSVPVQSTGIDPKARNPIESLGSSRSSPSSSASTVISPLPPTVPISAYEGGMSSSNHSPQLSRDSSSSGHDTTQSSFRSPRASQDDPTFSSPSISSNFNPPPPQIESQTPPRIKPNPWSPEAHAPPSNSFNASPSIQPRDLNQSWYPGASPQVPNQTNPSLAGEGVSKSMFVERPSPSQMPTTSQNQGEESRWNGMPSNSSFASRFGTLGGNQNQNPSSFPSSSAGIPSSTSSSFGKGASAYENPFNSSSSNSTTPNGSPAVNPTGPGFNSGRVGGLNSGSASFGSAAGGLNRSRISASDAAKQLAGRF